MKSAERNAAFGFVTARQLGDVQHVCEHLLAAMLEGEPDVRAGGFKQLPRLWTPLGRGCGSDAATAADCEAAKRWAVRCGLGSARNPERMKRAEAAGDIRAALHRQSRTAAPQRRKHRQLIVWPLDSGQRGAQSLDFARGYGTTGLRRGDAGCRAPRARERRGGSCRRP